MLTSYTIFAGQSSSESELKKELAKLKRENGKLRIQLQQKRTKSIKVPYNINKSPNTNTHSIGHNMELVGEDFQEFIDPELLENGDGTID